MCHDSVLDTVSMLTLELFLVRSHWQRTQETCPTFRRLHRALEVTDCNLSPFSGTNYSLIKISGSSGKL